jgi:hypothetical protein
MRYNILKSEKGVWRMWVGQIKPDLEEGREVEGGERDNKEVERFRKSEVEVEFVVELSMDVITV